MADDDGWNISVKGKQFGPYSLSLLKEWWDSGKVPPDATVSRNGGEWIAAPTVFSGGGSGAGSPDTSASNSTGVTPVTIAPMPASAPAQESGPSQYPQPEPQTAPADNDLPAGGIPTRDRIVVLGRRQSGKTIYLASLYSRLWKSLDGMTAKALSGAVHKELMAVSDQLQQGIWPGVTFGATQIELEIEYHNKQRMLVTLDYAGELFTKAFVDEATDWPGVKELIFNIDRARAVILIIDPSIISGKDHTAAMEDDFGLVQAAQRIRNWPGGDSVPIVVALTKADLYQPIIDRAGGPVEFVRAYLPALVRTLKKAPIFSVSAVQTETVNGKPRPKRDSVPINVDNPLRYCLRQIDKDEEEEAKRKQEEFQIEQEIATAKAIEDREKWQNRILIMTIVGIFLLGGVIVAWILFKG